MFNANLNIMSSRDESREDRGIAALIMLCAGGLMLIGGSAYLVQIFSVLYGAAAGALLQSNATGTQVAQQLQQTAQQYNSLHGGILESYVLLIISLLSFGVAFLMFLRYYDRGNSATMKKYAIPHIGFTLIYVMLFYVVVSPFYYYFGGGVYMYVVYAGIALSFASAAFLEYMNRAPAPSKSAKLKHTITINPGKPYSNMGDLQDELFSKLKGHIRIVDKHFNSVALANFHRLANRSVISLTKVTILTSKEMLDTDFTSNMIDFRSELNEAGVGVEVRLLDDKDSTEQHERMLLTDTVAYKIPPFNIINKRSEHITMINLGEALKRFNYLYSRAMKLENYMVRKDREPIQPPAA